MLSFEPISNFTSSYDAVEGPYKDFSTGQSHFYYDGELQSFRVPAGGIFRQYRVNDLYLIIALYRGYDYESFRFIILNSKLQFLDQYISPNSFYTSDTPYVAQFVKVAPDTLKFDLRNNDPWVVQALEKPKLLPRETLSRIRRGWWPNHELSRLFTRVPFSIRPFRS